MDEKQIPGGSGAALAAHSKDASVPGPAAASSATGNESSGTVSGFTKQAQDVADQVMSFVSDVAGEALDQLSERGVTVDQAAAKVRENPMIALLSAGVVGMVLGILLTKR